MCYYDTRFLFLSLKPQHLGSLQSICPVLHKTGPLIEQNILCTIFPAQQDAFPPLKMLPKITLHFNNRRSKSTALVNYRAYHITYLGRGITVGTATHSGWTVQGLNPGGGMIFHTHPDQSWAHPASYTMDTGSFPAVKRPGRGIKHPPPLNDTTPILCLHGRL
jgi:hypothetical protein